MTGTANPNPTARIPYAPDSYASDGDRPLARPIGAGRRRPDDDPEDPDQDDRGTSPWLWISGLLAIVILGLAAFLVLQLLNAREVPGPEQVAVPNLVGLSYEAAQTEAERVGLAVVRAVFEPSDQPDGTVLAQYPPPGGAVDAGTTIELTLALGDQTAAVPDLRGKMESDAVNLIATAKLVIGIRTEVFDDFIPIGAVVTQDPGPGVIVTQGLAVNYTVSRGPEPSPSATPELSPTPAPTPEASPTLEVSPTLPPTAAPTATPTPGPRNVGNYICMTLGGANAALENDGFVLGTVSTSSGLAPANDWIIVGQSPSAGTNRPFGSTVDLEATAPLLLSTCPP